ncbi:DegT/DnrJ/EryC1/StrS family aminotransferase [Pantoea sp.]|uniref:DegT/DnrJ/EryC1/StrS family aminotransferase n=1 Tax=Pantoea sp. TaxID=69393 RepID=UPI002899DF3A|nr:DegT/DnrJ/EryC1/StrS family aminotransferase [Pantoea sp.]
MNKNIFVTSPLLPPLQEFIPYLENIWSSQILTNNGPYHQQLEQQLAEYLDVEYLSLFNNGTLALIAALQVAGVTGEVITTPYSFVATAHSLLWNGLKPVFVDIDPETFNLDPGKIEQAITPQTTAILPVHCYGFPCDTKRISDIARAHGLKVIYDAAHAFGVKENNRSVLREGDLSILSFHATKVFNTVEGGAIVCHDAETKRRIDYIKNFGFENETTVVTPGINGKMNEVQAAYGLLQLNHIDRALEQRGDAFRRYHALLSGIKGISLVKVPEAITWNYAYYPVRVTPEYSLSRDELYERLRDKHIFARRYFYPLISEFAMYRSLEGVDKHNLAAAHQTAEQIICLPLYAGLEEEVQIAIADIIRSHG